MFGQDLQVASLTTRRGRLPSFGICPEEALKALIADIRERELEQKEPTESDQPSISPSLIHVETMCTFSWLPRGQFVERAPPEESCIIIL